MITKITCRYSFELLDFNCNEFGFIFNIEVSCLGIFYKTSLSRPKSNRVKYINWFVYVCFIYIQRQKCDLQVFRNAKCKNVPDASAKRNRLTTAKLNKIANRFEITLFKLRSYDDHQWQIPRYLPLILIVIAGWKLSLWLSIYKEVLKYQVYIFYIEYELKSIVNNSL